MESVYPFFKNTTVVLLTIFILGFTFTIPFFLAIVFLCTYSYKMELLSERTILFPISLLLLISLGIKAELLGSNPPLISKRISMCLAHEKELGLHLQGHDENIITNNLSFQKRWSHTSTGTYELTKKLVQNPLVKICKNKLQGNYFQNIILLMLLYMYVCAYRYICLLKNLMWGYYQSIMTNLN